MTPFLIVTHSSFGQSVTTFEFPNCGVPLDIISLKKDQVHLVSSQGVFQFKDNNFIRIESLDSFKLKPSSQSFHNLDEDYFYNSSKGGFNKLDLFQSKNSLPKTTRSFQSGIVLYGDNNIWIAEQDIYRNGETEWELFQKTDKNHNKFWDGKKVGDDIWLCNHGNGVYKISDENDIINYTQADGLYDNNCNSISYTGQQIFIGHSGAISIINDDDIIVKDLKREIGLRPIIEIEVLSNKDIIYLTPNQVFCESEKKIKPYQLPLTIGEEYISVHSDHLGSIWILSNKNIYRINSTPFESYDFASANSTNSFLYRIRNNTYFSNSDHVFGYNPQTKKWETHTRKKTPVTISRDREGNTILGLENSHAIKIDRKNAKILANYILPEGEVINHISEVAGAYYICTDENLYRKKPGHDIEIINSELMSFNNVLYNDQDVFVFGKKGVFKVVDDSLFVISKPPLNSFFPASSNQIIRDNKIICFLEKQLCIIDIQSNEASIIDFNANVIHDIWVSENLIYLLKDEALMSLEINELDQLSLNVIANIPLPHQLINPKLYDFDSDELWIKGQQRVLKIQKNNLINHQSSLIRLDRIITNNNYTIEVDDKTSFVFQESDLPLKLEFYTNNYWNTNPGYVYHIAGAEVNSSEWQSSSYYTFNPNEAGQYVINAKMRDDIFGQDVFSETIQINILKPDALSRKSLLIIPLFLFFAMILGYFASKSN